MALDDAKADELAKASRAAATAAKAATKLVGPLIDKVEPLIDKVEALEARVGALERRQDLTALAHELVGLTKSSPRIQSAVALAIVIAVAATALVYSPALPVLLPLLHLGGALAPTPAP